MNDYIDQLAREAYDLWREDAPDKPLRGAVWKYAGWLPPKDYEQIIQRTLRIAEDESFRSAFGTYPTRIDGKIQRPKGLNADSTFMVSAERNR